MSSSLTGPTEVQSADQRRSREPAWVLTNFRSNRAAWWLTALEVLQWTVFSTLLTYVVAVHPITAAPVPVLEQAC